MTGPQEAADAVRVATQVINDYGKEAAEAYAALDAAVDRVEQARADGATDDDIRNA